MDENKKQTNSDDLKTVRTYLSDMAETVRANEISVIKVALAEQNKREREKLFKDVEGTPTKKIFWFLGGLILIIVSVYGVNYFLNKEDSIKTEDIIPKTESLISFDEISPIVLTRSDYLVDKIRSINETKNLVNKADSIKYISIKEEAIEGLTPISIARFFSEMNFTAPTSLVRSLSDFYMVGSYTKNQTTDLSDQNNSSKIFMIFQSTDYEYTYAGMLEWEKTMANDLSYLFNTKTVDNLGTFKDLIINNKDSRVFVDGNKNILFYYTFVNQNDLIITNSESAILEIVTRLTIKKIKPL